MLLTGALLLALAAPGVPAEAEWPTLRQELEKHRIIADDFPDADREITSYAVHSDPQWFAIAYYWYTGSDLLPDELRLRTLDRASGTWRYTVINREQRQGGGALRLARRPGVVYLDLHMTPSAGQLLVLTEALDVKRSLAGWSSLVLPDGRVVYEHNMVHFAPFHAASVSLYDPATDRDVRLVPLADDPDPKQTPRNRSIGRIHALDSGRIRIQVTEQDLRWTSAQTAEPRGPERRFTVTCTISGPVPRCVTEEDADSGAKKER